MSPVTGLARLLGRILWWVYMENLSPVDRDEFKKYNQNGTLAPEVCLDFSPYESCERAAKRRERKTSGHFGRESHFHADARVRI